MRIKDCQHDAWEHIGNMNYVCMFCGKLKNRSTLQKPDPRGQWAKASDQRMKEKGDFYFGEYKDIKTYLGDE